MRKRQVPVLAAIALVASAVAPALAQEATLTCVNAGNTYNIGEFACIAACHGARQLARCDQVAESTTWTYVSDVCPSAHVVPPPLDNASQVPVVTRMSRLPGPLKISEFSPTVKLQLATIRLARGQAQ